MSAPETYEVYAIRYGTMDGRTRGDNFISTDLHDAPMPIDYFVWAIVNKNRTIVVDTGFDHKEAEERGRKIIRLPREGLQMVGVDAAKVQDVVITHLHYDHAGTLDDFSGAKFHLQEREIQYATGRHMCSHHMNHAYSPDHVCQMVRNVFQGRVQFHNGAREIAPGIEVHLIGGHTMGVQCVRVMTQRGWVVLASDASHFYENMDAESPFPIAYNIGDMVDGYHTMRRLAESDNHIVPGHDPLVMKRYPSLSPETQDVVVRLDVAPKL
ncbi:MAG: N-acyl homoserine lactonase family protein [Burkholderiaceae bacterium]